MFELYTQFTIGHQCDQAYVAKMGEGLMIF